MRRALSVVLITIVVTVLLVNFKARPALTIGAGSASRPVAGTQQSRARARPAAAAGTPATRRTVVGPAIPNPYGAVQVAATVAGTQLRDVRAVQLPSGGRSDEINSQAGPLLRQEAMAAQGGNIDTISGASYTSDGYRRSLQAALDRARA